MNENRFSACRKRGTQVMKQIDAQYPRVQDRLNRLHAAERRVVWIRGNLESLRMLTTDTSLHLTGMPRSGSPDQQRIMTALAKIDELERELVAAEEAAQALRLEFDALISGIENPIIGKMLRMYFFDHNTWDDICREIHFCPTGIFRLRRKGLAQMEEILKAEEGGASV